MRILLFGATGAAGGAVLAACLKASIVDEVRAITRKPLTITHAKLRNILHTDFLGYSAIATQFEGVDACLFCLGVSITKVSKDEYQKITHNFTLAAARTLLARSPSAAFHYISGQGTRPDSRMLKPFKSLYVHGEDLGRAMLQATIENLRKRIIENPEIRAIAARANF
jgi:uncharacterized protein YbjT (DUF2867 family)